LAGKVFQVRAQGDQANGLAAKDANFQEIRRFELLKEQIPHHMEWVFTKSPLLKIPAVRFEFLGQTLMKIAQALKNKTRWDRASYGASRQARGSSAVTGEPDATRETRAQCDANAF